MRESGLNPREKASPRSVEDEPDISSVFPQLTVAGAKMESLSRLSDGMVRTKDDYEVV